MGVSGFKKGIDPCLTALFQVMADNQPDGETDVSNVRNRCHTALWEAKPEPTAGSVPVLTAALGSDCGAVRQAAAMLLGPIGPDASHAVPQLVAALRTSLNLAAQNDPDGGGYWQSRKWLRPW